MNPVKPIPWRVVLCAARPDRDYLRFRLFTHEGQRRLSLAAHEEGACAAVALDVAGEAGRCDTCTRELLSDESRRRGRCRAGRGGDPSAAHLGEREP